MQPLNSINVWNSAWNVLAAECFCCLLVERKKQTKQINKQKTPPIWNPKPSVPPVFVWAETAAKTAATSFSYSWNNPGRLLLPELSSPFKRLLIKRDLVIVVRFVSADLSPTRVTICHQEVDRMAFWNGQLMVGERVAWSRGWMDKDEQRDRSTTVAAMACWEMSRSWAGPRPARTQQNLSLNKK